MPSEPRRPISLTLRLTAWIALVTSVGFLLFGWLIGQSLAHHFAVQDAEELDVIAHSVQGTLRGVAALRDHQQAQAKLGAAVAGHHGVYYLVADAQGHTLFATPGPDLSALLRGNPAAQHINVDALQSWTEGHQAYRGAVVHLSDPEAPQAPLFTVAVAATMTFHLHYLDRLRHLLLVGTSVASVLTILAVWLVVRHGLRPLQRISRQFQEVSADQLQLRLDTSQVPPELVELATAFNAMLDRIEAGFERLSNFSADIAHELRTPVTNLSTQTQVALTQARSVEAYREILYSSLEEYERMAKMIGDMLFLAQSDQHQLKLERHPLALHDEVQALFDYFEAWAEERGVRLSLVGQSPLVRGDRLMLRRALSNLLSNAIRYTPPGGTVRVELDQGADGPRLQVINPGPGIPPEHLPRLFERFYRADPSRQRNGDGAGLGLAIVQSIIEAHGGHISARSNQGETCFTVTWPAPPNGH